MTEEQKKKLLNGEQLGAYTKLMKDLIKEKTVVTSGFLRIENDPPLVGAEEGMLKLEPDGLLYAGHNGQWVNVLPTKQKIYYTETINGSVTFYVAAADGEHLKLIGEADMPADMEERLEELEKAQFPLEMSLSGWTLLEYAADGKSVALTCNIKRKGEAVSGAAVTVKKDGVQAHTGTTDSSGNVTVNANVTNLGITRFEFTGTKGGMQVTGVRNVELAMLMRFGFSAKTALTASDINGMAAQEIKSSPAGSYSLNNGTNGSYLWLCVGSNKSINKVTSSGFDVPMEAPVTVGNYKCYRSSNTIKNGVMDIVIS